MPLLEAVFLHAHGLLLDLSSGQLIVKSAKKSVRGSERDIVSNSIPAGLSTIQLRQPFTKLIIEFRRHYQRKKTSIKIYRGSASVLSVLQFFCLGLMPSAWIVCPRNSTIDSPNTHLPKINSKPSFT